MTHRWLSHGTALSLVTVDDHNRCVEVPPNMNEFENRLWQDLLAWAERQGGFAWGHMEGDCLTEWRGA